MCAVCLIVYCCKSDEQSGKFVLSPVSQEVKILITDKMQASSICWNNGDFEGYMDVYWKSDSMLFMGLNNITYGWQSTIDRYKQNYPTKAHRGTLTYDYKDFIQLSDNCVLLVGSFHLEREIGNAEGNFSLVWKIIDGEWKIILDHT